jgi:acyl carrier protein
LDKDAIFIKLKELLVSELKLDADSISPEKHLIDDLKLDSLDMVDFILCIEDYIGKKVDPSILKNAYTVQDVVDFVQPIWGTAVAPREQKA